MKRGAIIAALAAVLLAACGPPFPKELLEKLAPTVTYDALRADPGRHRGALLMLGGVIVDTKNLKDGTQIEVLQKPLDGRGRPRDTDETGGRFLIVTSRFLDGAVYHRGRMVTVIGEVTGQQILPLGEAEYRYPELTEKNLHLWPPFSGPRFSIGVGVYRGF